MLRQCSSSMKPIVRRLHQKAHHTFGEGYARPVKDIFTPRDPKQDEQDELSIFSGRTRTVATKAPQPTRKRSVSRHRAGPSAHSPTVTETSSSPGGDSLRTSQSPSISSPSQGSEDMPSLMAYGTAVHPMLVDDMRAFEGQLDAQIQNAQQQFYQVGGSAQAVRAKTGGAYAQALPMQEYEPQTVGYEQPEEPDWRWQQQEIQPPPLPAHAHQPTYDSAYHLPHQQQQQYYDSPPVSDPRTTSYAAVPMYGGADSGPTGPSRSQSGYIPSPPQPVQTQYMMQPQQQQPQEYWHSPVTPTEYHAQGAVYHEPASAHYQHAQPQSRSQSIHGQPSGFATAHAQHPSHHPSHHPQHVHQVAHAARALDVQSPGDVDLIHAARAAWAGAGAEVWAAVRSRIDVLLLCDCRLSRLICSSMSASHWPGIIPSTLLPSSRRRLCLPRPLLPQSSSSRHLPRPEHECHGNFSANYILTVLSITAAAKYIAIL